VAHCGCCGGGGVGEGQPAARDRTHDCSRRFLLL